MSQSSALYILDGIGPFFQGNHRDEINWSKIDFSDLDSGGEIPGERRHRIEEGFRLFIRNAAAMGYNAITLDDLAHSISFPFYPEALKKKIESYRELYRSLFALAAEAGLKIFITTDLLFFHPSIGQTIGNRPQNLRLFTADCCRLFFESFPETEGIIFRTGESDGVDVDGDFRSRLILKTAPDARRMLQTLLPVFESSNKLLIFRTWTVGANPLGDLIWNRDTFRRVFGTLHSPNLIISMKHGESDFFRFLPLNRLFFESDHRKLVELQARREYEGFGQFPSFIGYDCEKIRKELTFARNLAGISVWCQTGGWSGFRRLTLLEDSGIWNEINAYVIVRIFRDRLSADRAVQSFCNERLNRTLWIPLKELLELSDRVIKNLLYTDEFATRHIFFRRLRMPPLIAVYWKHILITHLMRKIMRCYVSRSYGKELTRIGYRTLHDIRRMREIAEEMNLRADDFDFQYDTFRILSAARAYYFLDHPERTLKLLEKMKIRYELKWPEPRYAVQIDNRPFPVSGTLFRRMVRLLFRRRSDYRMMDRLLAFTFYTLFRPLIARINHRIFPEFAKKQAMGINAVFK